MPIYKWRRVPTKHFGEVWAPFAHVEIANSRNEYQAFSLFVDSGAVVSLLRRSVADLLEIDLTSGREVELGSVGGARTEAYVHDLQIRIAPDLSFAAPFAIATNETVPNLLGRLGIFDVLQVDFDATMNEVGISTPWLDAESRRDWEFLIRTEHHILKRFNELELTTDTRVVARQFVDRGGQILASATGLLKVHRTYVGPAIIRPMFELALQFEYLMQDPDARAKQYSDFQKVSKYRLMRRAQSSKGPIGRYLRQSPLRDEGEARNEAEYREVRERFVRIDKRGREREWDNWYGMSIFGLAQTLGPEREDEYRVIYAQCSAWAHADPFSTSGDGPGPLTEPGMIFYCCIGYYARILRAIADTGKAVLEAEQYEFLKEVEKGFS